MTFKDLRALGHDYTTTLHSRKMESYDGLLLNKAIKTVRVYKGHRKLHAQSTGTHRPSGGHPPQHDLTQTSKEKLKTSSTRQTTSWLASSISSFTRPRTTESRSTKESWPHSGRRTATSSHVQEQPLAGPEPEVTFHAGPMANNAADNALQRLRINECQKPNLLAHDATPEEFRSWAKRFKAFCASSMLQHGPIKEQQAYLNMCLDIMLETSFGSKIDPDMPIFQDDENPDDNYCIQHLEDLFLRKYLLDTRCYNYFNSRQPRGMTMSTFIPTLKKKPKKQKSLVYETTNYTH